VYDDDDILDSGAHRRPSPLAFALAAVAAAGLTGAGVGGLAWMVDYAPPSNTSFDSTTGFDPGAARVGNPDPSASAVPEPFHGVAQSTAPDPAQAGTPVGADRASTQPETVAVDERDGRPAGPPAVAVPAVPAVPVPEVPGVPVDAVPPVPEVPAVPAEPMPADLPPAVAPPTDPWNAPAWADPGMDAQAAPIETTAPEPLHRQQPRRFERRHTAVRPSNPFFDHWFFE
jgi:hypothetical protein